MTTATKICKVCGKEYEYCHTFRRVAGVFRWQDVACSPEHGSAYLAKVEASRMGENVHEEVSEEIDDLRADYEFDEEDSDEELDDEDDDL